MGTASSKKAVTAGGGESSGEASDSLVEDMQAWALVYNGALPSWKYSAVLWGFDPRIDYTSNVKARLQPWCTGGRYFSVKYDSPNIIMERPFFLITITEGCFKRDTHIRLPCAYQGRLYSESEPSGHYLKAVQVVGYRDGIAVLQVNCQDNIMEFMVVHMKTGSVVGIFKEEVSGKHYLCDCMISPDLSSFILKPNAMYVLNFCRGEYRNVMKLVSCKGDNCPLLKKLFENMAVRPFVAFDPRYCWRRVAIGNYLCSGRDVVCVYDLQDEQVVVHSDSVHYQTTHNIVYSPDGIYLASLVLGRSVKDGLFNFPRVLIYNSADLRILHTIKTNYLAEVPTLSPAALFPLFSETGTGLAISHGEQGTFYQQVCGVNVYRVPVQLDLQSLCRLAIRVYFDSQDVERLPLPSKLKAYLRFQPCYS